MPHELDYVNGFRDGLNDAASLIERLYENQPKELNGSLDFLSDVAKSIRRKAETSMAMAESITEASQ